MEAVRVTAMIAPAFGLGPEAVVEIPVARRLFLKRQWSCVAPDGTVFEFALESRLADGCVVHHAGGRDYVLRQLPEKVYEIRFVSGSQAAAVAWKTGNLHLPAEILPDGIRVLHDPLMEKLIQQEGWEYSEPEVVFRPLRVVPHATG